MASVAPTETDKLARLVQNLPQEFYDKIYNFTFGAVQIVKVTIDANYRPPATLQVDKISRTIFSEACYTTCDFHLSNGHQFCEWLSKIPASDEDMIQNATYKSGSKTEPDSWLLHLLRVEGLPVKIANLVKVAGATTGLAGPV